MSVTRITMHSVDIEDKPGSLQKFLAQSSLSKVDYQCFAAFSLGNNCGRVFAGAKEPKVFEAFAKEAELDYRQVTGFILDGEDRIGAAADALKMLAENDVNEIAGSAMVFDGAYKMVVMVDSADAQRAEALLGA